MEKGKGQAALFHSFLDRGSYSLAAAAAGGGGGCAVTRETQCDFVTVQENERQL